MMPLLELDNLTVRFGGLTAVDGVELQVEPRADLFDHRAQRRRQDDRLQRHHRHLRADRRRIEFERDIARGR